MLQYESLGKLGRDFELRENWFNPFMPILLFYFYQIDEAGPRSAVGSTSDSKARGAGFDTRYGHILSFLLPLIQEGQLSVTGKSMCTKYWLTAQEVKVCPGKMWIG